MGDLKSPFTDPVAPVPDLSGAGVTSRGTDPNVNLSGASGLQTPFDNPIYPNTDGQESANSVSGLPALPNRFAPSETPPDPPSLEDRNPGTIDKR